jgi:hypothetical protein
MNKLILFTLFISFNVNSSNWKEFLEKEINSKSYYEVSALVALVSYSASSCDDKTINMYEGFLEAATVKLMESINQYIIAMGERMKSVSFSNVEQSYLNGYIRGVFKGQQRQGGMDTNKIFEYSNSKSEHNSSKLCQTSMLYLAHTLHMDDFINKLNQNDIKLEK